VSINYTPHVFVTAEIVTAATLNAEIGTPFTGLQAAWTGFTPSLIGATTNPVVNNGSAVGRYFQDGKTFWYRLTITFGSTSTYGSGIWSIVLPFITTTPNVANLHTSAMCHYFHNAGSVHLIGQAILLDTSATNSLVLYTSQTAADGLVPVTPTAPWTWATSDSLHVDGKVESA
jgi:hypothetical protein